MNQLDQLIENEFNISNLRDSICGLEVFYGNKKCVIKSVSPFMTATVYFQSEGVAKILPLKELSATRATQPAHT